MIQSRLKFYILLFKKNDAQPRVLLEKDSGNVPVYDMLDDGSDVKSIIDRFSFSQRLSLESYSYKLVDCQINNSVLEICYYNILPFGYDDPVHEFIDIAQIDTSEFPNLQKTIRLL